MKLILCIIFVFFFGMLSLMVNQFELINILPFIYFGVFLFSFYAMYNKKDIFIAYFRPSSVIVLYVSFFFFMGTTAFKYGLVQLHAANMWRYYRLENLGVVSFYFICAICVTLFSQLFHAKKWNAAIVVDKDVTYLKKKQFSKSKRLIIISVFLIALTVLIEIPLPGGTGSFSSNFFMFAAIYISYVLKLKDYKYRIIIYILFGSLLASVFYVDRRLLFYFVFCVSFIELFDKNKIKIRSILFLAIAIVLLFIANVSMSIARGVGSFGAKSVVSSVSYVGDYLKSDWAKTMLLHNFEGPASTFHSYNAVDYILQKGDYKYGSTVAKIFFLPISREIFPEKTQKYG